MSNRYLLLILVWGALLLLGTGLARAAPWLDQSFGFNGRVAVELGVKNNGHAVVVQPDGKIVVAGSSSDGTGLNFSLVRFNRDGSLDAAFNGDGTVITSLSTGDDEALALGLLSDGRIVAAGYRHNGTDRDFAMVCYLPNGSRDLMFGRNGGVVVPIGNGNEEITALAINAEDVITVAGVTEGTVGRVLVTARFFADGDLDDSYGEEGVSVIGVGQDFVAEGIIERKDGSLVISGSCVTKKGSSVMLVGLDAYGALADSFGNKGVAVSSGLSAASEGYGLTEDGEGHLYLAGSVGNAGKRDTALFCFTKTGKAELSFGDQGVIITRVSEEDDVLSAVKVGNHGMVASGYTTDAGIRQFLLVTFPWDNIASMPTSFKKASIRTTFSEGESVSSAVAFAASGHVIVVGSAVGIGASSMVVARYTDETTTDSIADQSGYASSHIAATPTDACFIATASFGSLLHPGVTVLRDFRDTFLVNTPGGQRLVDIYYTLSPPVANYIARHEWLRFAVRLILLPCIGFAWLALQGGIVGALLTFVGTATILGWFSSRVCMRR